MTSFHRVQIGQILRIVQLPWPTVKTLELALSFSCYLSLFGTETPPETASKRYGPDFPDPGSICPSPNPLCSRSLPSSQLSDVCSGKAARANYSRDVQTLRDPENLRAVIFSSVIFAYHSGASFRAGALLPPGRVWVSSVLIAGGRVLHLNYRHREPTIEGTNTVLYSFYLAQSLSFFLILASLRSIIYFFG